MEAIWHYSDGGQRHGPVTAAELKALADSGQLKLDSLVWKDGMSEWKPAKSVKGLFAAKPQPEDRPSKPEDRPSTRKQSSLPATRKIILALGLGFGGMFVMCCGGCAVISVIGEREMRVVRQEMADADALWMAGKKQEAVAKYRPRLDSSMIDDQTRPIAFGRTIDLAFENGDVMEGQRVIELASSRRVAPSVNCPQAKKAVVEFEERKRRAEAEKQRAEAERKQTEDMRKKQAAKKKSKYTRSEFKSAVIGLTKNDLIELMGRPASTQEDSLGEYWYYDGLTTDPASGKTDNGAQVIISRGGSVTNVNFH